MNDVKNVVVEETMEGLTEDVLTADVVETAGFGKKALGVAVLLLVTGGVSVLVKKVIVPKIRAKKAAKQAKAEAETEIEE